MGPLLLSVVGAVAGTVAGNVFDSLGKRKLPGPRLSGEREPVEKQRKERQRMSIYDDEVSGEVGADDIVISGDDDDEVSGEDDEVGARRKRKARARPRATTRGGRPAVRRIAFLPGVAIAAGATSALPVTLNAPFKGVGMRVAGTNMNLLLFNGATIRGRPQEGSQGSVGCDAFSEGDTFYWEWDTVNPGESFTLSFTNTHNAALTPLGFLAGFLAP